MNINVFVGIYKHPQMLKDTKKQGEIESGKKPINFRNKNKNNRVNPRKIQKNRKRKTTRHSP